MFPGEDTPDQKRPPASSTEDQSLHRVFGSERMMMKGCSGVIERNREKMYKFIDEIVENASSVQEMGLIEKSVSEKLRVLEVKETESELRRVNEESLVSLVLGKQIEAGVSRIQDQENKLALIYQSVTKTFDALKTEFKEEAHQLRKSIHDKLCALEKAEIDLDLKQRVETERLKLESKQLEAKKNELTLLEEAIREKSAALKRKEKAFELKQKEQTEKQRGETEPKGKDLENNEEKIKELEVKQMELKEGLQQQLINAETRKRRSNVEFEPLTGLAKIPKFQEADKSVEDPKRLICPRKGETWALYRDWDITWNSQPDLHEPPYRYDFVEVISEFYDHQGIAVELISAQHGIMEIVIPPEEMQRFSHKVAGSIGEEKEDCGSAITAQDQDGSTKDMAIILD